MTKAHLELRTAPTVLDCGIEPEKPGLGKGKAPFSIHRLYQQIKPGTNRLTTIRQGNAVLGIDSLDLWITLES